jgi:hypothetical protein
MYKKIMENKKMANENKSEIQVEAEVTPTNEEIYNENNKPKLSIKDRMSKAMDMINAGKTCKEIMEELDVSTTYVYKLIKANPLKEKKPKKAKVEKVPKVKEAKIKMPKPNKVEAEIPAVINAKEENIEAVKNEE